MIKVLSGAACCSMVSRECLTWSARDELAADLVRDHGVLVHLEEREEARRRRIGQVRAVALDDAQQRCVGQVSVTLFP